MSGVANDLFSLVLCSFPPPDLNNLGWYLVFEFISIHQRVVLAERYHKDRHEYV